MVMAAVALGQGDVTQAADANPPERMTYQGYLVDGNGAPLGNSAPTNYDVVFRIYKAKQGGNALWAEQQTVTVDKGYFSVLLGEGADTASGEPRGSLSGAFDGADASDRFIGITVSGLGGGDVEIAPRLRLVTSPYAFTASQARKVSDGSGNRNFYKDGTDLKLGAGSTPTLTLPEAGGGTLSGALTLNLPDWGNGLIINANGQTTTFEANDAIWFDISTGASKFYFNKPVAVKGGLLSYNTDATLGPSNNTDTYLQVHDDSDKITAQADEFRVQGDSNYLQTKFSSNKVELHTDAGSVYLNKPLSVTGIIEASSDLKSGGDVYMLDDIRFTNADGNAWMIPHNATGKKGTLYQRFDEVQIEGSGKLKVGGDARIDGNRLVISGTNPTVSLRDSGEKDYYVHANEDRFYILRGEGDAGWDSTRPLTIWQGDKVGINQATPLDELHIVHGTNGNYAKGLRIQRQGGHYWAIGVDYVGDLVFGFNQDDSTSYKAYVNDGNGAWVTASDRRLKTDIEPIGDVLNKVGRLQPSRYRFKTESEEGEKSYGFIAQDVQKEFPELVEDKDGYLSLGYDAFGVLSIKAIQELRSEKNRELAKKEEEINELKARLAKLEALVAGLAGKEG